MKNELETLRRALGNYRGDDLYRARAAFRDMTPEKMAEEHGQSGRTRAEIIAEYEAHERKCDDAAALLDKLEAEGV